MDEEYPDFTNKVKKIEKQPKANVRKKTILKDEQINALLEHLSKTNKQEACFLALACFSGARISELFRFTTKLINPEHTAYDGLFIETEEEIKTKGRGKNGKSLYKYILKEPFMPYYNAWMEERQKFIQKNCITHDFLFIKKNGSPATQSDCRNWITKWETFLTYEDPNNLLHENINLYAHAFRHYLCTFLARAGLEQELVVEIFGWSSSDMFKIYNDMTAKDREWKSLDKLKAVLEEKQE